MKATKFQNALIAAKSIFVTLWITIITIFRAHRRSDYRLSVDRRLRWWSRKLLEFVDLSYRTVNPHQVSFGDSSQPTILMCNHSSLYDIPITLLALPGSIRMLTKEELFRVPLWGRGMEDAEFISIDRHNRRQAVKDLQRARAKMETGVVLWIAPEGTRSRTANLQPFKKGGFMLAIRTGARIVPIGIRGASEVLAAKTLQFNLHKQVELHVGEPIDASRYNQKTRDRLMREVEAQIRELAALPAAATKVGD